MAVDLITIFAQDLELRGMAPGTCKTYCRVLRQFSRYFEAQGKLVQDVGKPELKDWLHYLRLERGLKTTSIEVDFAILTSFYDYLLDEEMIKANPIPAFRRRNLHSYKKAQERGIRKLISVEEASRLVHSIIDSRDKAIVLMLLKTGVRRHELADLDIQDVDLQTMTMQLKPTPKRTNRTVFFDYEALEVLEWWLETRSRMLCVEPALFVGTGGFRLKPDSINRIVEEHAVRVGLHDLNSKKIEDRLTAHCCRHWFTTHLRRAGMPREFIQELRGDVRREAIDIYDHIDKEELRKSYLAHVPQLGV
jgi:integrase/recombinase XerD